MGNSRAYAVVISPLRKLRRRGPNKGLIYTRVEKITAKLGELLQLSEKERIKRCAIVDKSDAGFIPPECVLHLVRSFRKDQANPAFEAFFTILYARLLRRLLRLEKEHSTALTAEAIRDHALDRFRKWLSADLQEYEERLDFFEVRFDMAMKKLRANAESSVLDKAKKVQDKLGTDFKSYYKPELTYAGGLITCAHCGRVVTGEKKSKNRPDGTKREHSYYRCSGISAPGHPKVRLAEAEVDRQLLPLLATIKLDDDAREWFVEVIRARAHAGQAENRQDRQDLQRQYEQVEAKLAGLLVMRMEGEIDAAEYSLKRADLHDRHAGLRAQLDSSCRDGHEIAELALKAFELSQTLEKRWILADYQAKRTLLSVTLEACV